MSPFVYELFKYSGFLKGINFKTCWFGQFLFILLFGYKLQEVLKVVFHIIFCDSHICTIIKYYEGNVKNPYVVLSLLNYFVNNIFLHTKYLFFYQKTRKFNKSSLFNYFSFRSKETAAEYSFINTT